MVPWAFDLFTHTSSLVTCTIPFQHAELQSWHLHVHFQFNFAPICVYVQPIQTTTYKVSWLSSLQDICTSVRIPAGNSSNVCRSTGVLINSV